MNADDTKQTTKRSPDFSIILNLGKPQTATAEGSEISEPVPESGIRLEYAADESKTELLGKFFTFEFYSEHAVYDESRNNYQNWFQAVLERLIIALHQAQVLHLGSVDRICFADADTLGEVIFQIQDEKGLQRGYTGNTGYHHTIGKTIAYRSGEDPERVISAIVFNWGLYNTVVDSLHQFPDSEDWSFEGKFVFNMFAHELAHARDFFFRKVVSTDPSITPEETDWEKISAYYSEILFEEYLACLLSSSTITSDVQKHNIESWQAETRDFIGSLLRRRHYLVAKPNESIITFWTILLQLAKLLGNDRGEDDLPEIVFSLEDYDEEQWVEEKSAIVAQLAASLEGFLENYPQVPPPEEITEKLKTVFLRLAAIYGYYFREEDFPKGTYEDDDY